MHLTPALSNYFLQNKNKKTTNAIISLKCPTLLKEKTQQQRKLKNFLFLRKREGEDTICEGKKVIIDYSEGFNNKK